MISGGPPDDNGNNDKGVHDDPGEDRIRHDTLREFNAILQRDSTDTTYKYALLRALVEIAEQEYHHVRAVDNEWAAFPLGLIIERWLYYYYPFIARRLPQRHGESPRGRHGTGLAFRREFEKITNWYERRGGLAAFALDLREHGIPAGLHGDFAALVNKLRYTVTRYPMKHLGFSWYGDHYQVVTWDPHGSRSRIRPPFNRETLIAAFGDAQLRRRYLETFRAVGGFATGAEAIFAQWARFTNQANPKEPVTLAEATDALLTVPVDDRNVRAANEVYRRLIADRRGIECVWSGARIATSQSLAIDHAIPFSLWGTNALWNLLPATRTANSKKSDRIPAPDLVDARRKHIIEYWQSTREALREAFQSDFRVSLAGMKVDFDSGNWMESGVISLREKCAYLIDERGYEPWRPVPSPTGRELG